MPRLNSGEDLGYSAKASKWSWREFRMIPQGVKYVGGPRSEDTIERRKAWVFQQRSKNFFFPTYDRVRWYEPAYDERD